MDEDPAGLAGRDLGLATAKGMIRFEESVGFPTALNEIPGFGEEHIERALDAAKNPQLRMKLENMPVPMTTEMIETYMRPILEAASTGEIERVKNVL
jgi:glycerol dehydrogenase-like iron-containing ADH family enzyme